MYRISKPIIFLMTCLIAIILLSGCWNNKDVTERAIVIAVGLDKTADNKIEATVQVAKPAVIQAKSKGGTSEKAYWVYTVSGDTIFEALRSLHVISNRRSFMTHVQLMVIGEELAREGISDALDFFERDHEANVKLDMLIAKGTTAKTILEAESNMENIPAIHLKETLKTFTAYPRFKKIMLIEFISEMESPGKCPTIGTIEVVKKESTKPNLEDMKIEGAAIFKTDKLIGWLDPVETRGLLFVEDQLKSAIINVSNPLVQNKKVSIEIIRSKGKQDAHVKDGKLVLAIEIKEEGQLGNEQGSGDLTTSEMVEKLEEENAKAIEREIRHIVDLAQKKYKCDIFGFGDIVHKKYLDYWNQVKDNWNEEFSNIPVEIKVSSKIRRSGIILQPAKPE